MGIQGLNMTKEQILASNYVYSGRAINLRVDTVKLPSGRRTTRETIEHPDCIVVVPVDEQDNVLMVRQFRHPVNRTLLELPAGGVEKGERPRDAVRRELQEEIGYLPQRVKSLGGFYSAPGFCTEYLYLYLATKLTPSRLVASDTEEIEVVKMPLPQIPNLIASGQICDAKSVAGLLRYLREN
jgi:ADP-ribose pyrophosphatase